MAVETQASSSHQNESMELKDLSGFATSSKMAEEHIGTREILNAEPPEHAVDALERWNGSTGNIVRTFAAFFGLLVMGMNDAVYGAIIPYLEGYYTISYTVVSLIFISPALGYISAAAFNDRIHGAFGQRGVAIIGPSAHIIAYCINLAHPPFPVLVVSFVFAGFGNGLLDAAWNAWLGNMANANEVLGFLHCFYGIGAVLAPLIATTLITKSHVEWYYFYYIMVGCAGLELLSSTLAFWKETGSKFRALHPATTQGGGNTREALKNRVTWVCALFLFVYMGIEVGLGGWIVVFMQNERHGEKFASGMVATGFWLGIAVGRAVLGFVTARVGENLAITIYLIAALIGQLLFWLIPSFYVSAVTVSIIGFFLGPLFPAAVVAATKLLPRELHVGAIGFGAAIGGTGACVFPFAVGAISQAASVKVLQPIIVAMLSVEVMLWTLGMPSMKANAENLEQTPWARLTSIGKKIIAKLKGNRVVAT